jgi:signal transduction histidine kinase
MMVLVTIPFVLLAFQHAQYAKQQLISEKEQTLLRIATLLQQRFPDSFDSLFENSGAVSVAEKRSILYKKLQPILREAALEWPDYGFGYYDKRLHIVALIPENTSLLGATAADEVLKVYETKRTETVLIPSGFTHDGKRLMSVNYPLFYKGEAIGHIWATVKNEDIEEAYFLELVKTLGLLVIVLLVILLGVWWILWNEKITITKLAEQIKAGEEAADHFHDFPQIYPLVQTVAALRDQLKNEYATKELVAAEMARLDRLNLIGEMAAGVVHEIRNPMTVIRGYIQRMMQKASGVQADKYAIILEELDNMNTTLTAFLSLAKNRRVEIGLHNVNTIIRNIMPLIETDVCKAGVTLRFEPTERPLMVYADDKEIRQLVLNLTRNAIEATPAKGILTVRTSLVGNAVCLTVADTGGGIAPWHIKKIFDPFFTTKDNGTGLGLAICKSIIDRHNGRIEVNSQQGAGTTFRIEIPAVA